MKELYIFRIFVFFPLIGICVPDMATAFNNSISSISADHIIVDIALIISIAICSIGILHAESKKLKAA